MHIEVSTKTVGNLDIVANEIKSAHEKLINKSGAGSDFTGWVTLPNDYDRAEFARVKAAAEKIMSDSQVLVVIGIGGSYLGARAAIEFLKSPFYNNKTKNTPDIYFAGNNISADYLTEIIELIGNRDFSINVISKSGSTVESAIALRIFKSLIEEKYGKEDAKKRIYVTTDKASGTLKKQADIEGYETFVIPENIGGRFSVLTPVGLLPIAVCGADIDDIMRGAADEMNEMISCCSIDNPAWKYAAARNILYRNGKKIELLACFEPRFRFIAEWWKQLFGESEGKNSLGLFPASAEFTTDLHSMGQYIQDGERILFETVITITKPFSNFAIEHDENNLDELNYLAGHDINLINQLATKGTMLAHIDGNVPNIEIKMPDISEYSLGALFAFFEFSCGISGYTLGINPFDQPGVELYKKNMFALLGKPGFSELREALLKRL